MLWGPCAQNMTFQQAIEYLNSFINFEHKLNQITSYDFKLDRVQHLLKALGNPQDKYKIIHVAGSKGKGSTCAFTASILKQAGYRVGLYTSPHLNEVRERIRILSFKENQHNPQDIFPDEISQLEFAKTLQGISPAIHETLQHKEFERLTFFEVLTAMALYYFAQKGIDFAVLETGLGGRLDATNVVNSLACGLTPISLEHNSVLGPTLGLIAQEKAAVIKDKNQTVVIAPQEKEAKDVFLKRCREFSITPCWVGEDIKVSFQSQDSRCLCFDVVTSYRDYPFLRSPLLGRHQMENAALAIGLVENLKNAGVDIPREAIFEGIQEVFWPGRFEIISREPMVILDSAHNEASCRVLAQTIKEIFPEKRAKLVLGISDDKNKEGMCRVLNTISDEVVATRANHPRAGELEEALLQKCFLNKKILRALSVQEALAKVLSEARPNDILLVTGSIFVVGEAREFFLSQFKSTEVV